MPHLTITHPEGRPDVFVVKPAERIEYLKNGEIVASIGEELDTLVAQKTPGEKRTIIFDLSGIKEADSAMLSRFFKATRQLRTLGDNKLVLAAMPPEMAEAFKITKLDIFIDRAGSVGDALETSPARG